MPDRVTREIDLPIGPAEAWAWMSQADELGSWLGADVELDVRPAGRGVFRFEDGEIRFAMVETVDHGRSVEFRWWPAQDRGRASRVAIELEPSAEGTRVRVTETRLHAESGRVVRPSALACA